MTSCVVHVIVMTYFRFISLGLTSYFIFRSYHEIPTNFLGNKVLQRQIGSLCLSLSITSVTNKLTYDGQHLVVVSMEKSLCRNRFSFSETSQRGTYLIRIVNNMCYQSKHTTPQLYICILRTQNGVEPPSLSIFSK